MVTFFSPHEENSLQIIFCFFVENGGARGGDREPKSQGDTEDPESQGGAGATELEEQRYEV